MKPVDYVIALLDADPQGWEMWKTSQHYLAHSNAGLLIWVSNGASGVEVLGKVPLTNEDLGFFGRRKLWKAVERQKTAALAQKLLEACEEME